MNEKILHLIDPKKPPYFLHIDNVREVVDFLLSEIDRLERKIDNVAVVSYQNLANEEYATKYRSPYE